jgi:hypothetical protein
MLSGEQGALCGKRWPDFPPGPMERGHGLLGRNPSHLAKTVIREILSLPVFDGLQNETGDELGPVAIGVLG